MEFNDRRTNSKSKLSDKTIAFDANQHAVFDKSPIPEATAAFAEIFGNRAQRSSAKRYKKTRGK